MWDNSWMGIQAIDHVQLVMPSGQEDAASALYRDVLGLEEVPTPQDLATEAVHMFETAYKLHGWL